jgi:hypothetical protein
MYSRLTYCHVMGLRNRVLRLLRANVANMLVGALVAVTLAVVLLDGGRGGPTSHVPSQVHTPNYAQVLPVVVTPSCARAVAGPACPPVLNTPPYLPQGPLAGVHRAHPVP